MCVEKRAEEGEAGRGKMSEVDIRDIIIGDILVKKRRVDRGQDRKRITEDSILVKREEVIAETAI